MRDWQEAGTKKKTVPRIVEWGIMIAVGISVVALSIFSNQIPKPAQVSAGTVVFGILTMTVLARALELYWGFRRQEKLWLIISIFLFAHVGIWLALKSLLRIWIYILVVLIEAALLDVVLRRFVKAGGPY